MGVPSSYEESTLHFKCTVGYLDQGSAEVFFCEKSCHKHTGILQAKVQNQGCYVGTSLVRENIPQIFYKIQNIIIIEYNVS